MYAHLPNGPMNIESFPLFLTEEQALSLGFRIQTEVEPIPEGYRVTYGIQDNNDGRTCKLVIVDRVNIAEEEAAARKVIEDAIQAAEDEKKKRYAYPKTGEMNLVRPKEIITPAGKTFNPTEAQCFEVGYRLQTEVEAVPEGYRVTYKIEDNNDGQTCKLVIDTRVNLADEKAAQDQAIIDARQARIDAISPMLKMQAAMFRTIIRRYFGANAETNRDVTYTAVFTYFVGKQSAGTITVQEIADMYVLEKLYVSITAWTMDDTTWSFPWEIIPE